MISVNKSLGNFSVSFTPQYYKTAYNAYAVGNYKYLIALFDRAENHSFVTGCMTARNAGFKRNWDIIAASESPQDVAVKDFVYSVLSQLNMRDLFEYVVEARHKKYSVVGLEWDVVKGKQIITSFKKYDQKYFRYDDKGILGIDWGMKILPFEEDSAFIIETEQKPLFLKILKDFIRLEFGEEAFDAFIENFGEPIIEVEYPAGDSSLKKEAESAANSIGRSTRIAKPSGTNLTIHETNSSTGNHESHNGGCEKNISFTLLGHQNAAGNSKAFQVGDDATPLKVSEKIAVDDMYFIEEKIKQLIFMLVKRNFPVVNLPAISIDKSSTVDSATKLRAAELGLANGAQIEASFLQEFGIPIVNPDVPLKRNENSIFQ